MGSWGVLGPAVLSLVGVAPGAVGSLFGQYLVSRVSARQSEAQEAAAHRAELKGVIPAYRFAARLTEAARGGGADAAVLHRAQGRVHGRRL